MSPTLTSGEGNQQLCKTTNVTLLNDFYTDYPQAHVEKPLVEFSLFPSLPHEICSAIWKCNLRRHRLISIQVTDEDDTACPSGPSSSLPYTDTNGLGNIISGRNYRLSVPSNHRLSPLLQVCHGSRRAALEFYRLHIPYDLKAHGEQHCLYLNPEFDFLHIKQRGAPELFVDLLHDAKAYDPLGAGLLNVGIGEIHPEDLQLPMNPATLAPLALSTFTAALNSLERVFFHHVVHYETRQMFNSIGMEEVRYNRSYPLNSQTEVFDLLDTDPRPITADLAKVSVGWDPREPLCLWQEMESKFQIRRSHPVEFQFLITASSHRHDDDSNVLTRGDAGRFLQYEEAKWNKPWEEGELFQRLGYINPNTPEIIKQASMPVFGFWLFHVDAFGDIPKGQLRIGRNGRAQWEMKMVKDLTKHSPQLGVFRLPHD